MLHEWSDREPPRRPRLARALERLGLLAVILLGLLQIWSIVRFIAG